MTTLNIQVNRGLDGKFQKLANMVEGFRDEYLEKMSAQLIFASPVDTGTYIRSHNLGTSAVGATTSSTGKPRKQPYEPNAQAGFQNLMNDIAGLPDTAIRLVFSNSAYHSDVVEYELGYAPYRIAANQHGNIAAQAAATAKARFT